MGPRAAGSSPLFATRWKRRPAMHGSPGAKIMAMAIWKSPASMELLNGKNHGNIMGEHPTGPGSLEPSRGSKYCSSTVRLRTGLQWTIQSINGKNSTVNFENVPRITGADYQRAYKKNQNDMEKPRGNPRVFMIKWWVFMDLSILMLICGQVKEWRKVWVGNRSADGWFWSFIIFYLQDIQYPLQSGWNSEMPILDGWESPSSVDRMVCPAWCWSLPSGKPHVFHTKTTSRLVCEGSMYHPISNLKSQVIRVETKTELSHVLLGKDMNKLLSYVIMYHRVIVSHSLPPTC